MKKRRLNLMKSIVGIDPGSRQIGYGVISYHLRDNLTSCRELKPKVLDYGYLDIQHSHNEGKKLLQLYKDLREILLQYKPECVAIESIYFFKNAKTFTPVVQSKGVILFTAAEVNINVFEYTPLQVKQTITGYGKADKGFIQKLVRASLNINSTIKPDDASDALAVALCHLRHLTCF